VFVSSVVEPKLFVSAPVPAPAPTFKSFGFAAGSDFSFVSTCLHSFKVKSRFFMFFRNEYQLNSLALSYSTWIMIFIYRYYFSLTRSREPEPKLHYTGSGQKFRLLAAPAPQHSSLEG
jgi:hypothetical protein